MEILGVTYSAKIDLSPVTFAQVHTMFYGGTWQWFGYVHEVESVDELLIKHTRIVSKVQSAVGQFWVSSEDALADGVAQFYTEPDEEGEYPGDVLPTGWDAQDHKALFE